MSYWEEGEGEEEVRGSEIGEGKEVEESIKLKSLNFWERSPEWIGSGRGGRGGLGAFSFWLISNHRPYSLFVIAGSCGAVVEEEWREEEEEEERVEGVEEERVWGEEREKEGAEIEADDIDKDGAEEGERRKSLITLLLLPSIAVVEEEEEEVVEGKRKSLITVLLTGSGMESRIRTLGEGELSGYQLLGEVKIGAFESSDDEEEGVIILLLSEEEEEESEVIEVDKVGEGGRTGGRSWGLGMPEPLVKFSNEKEGMELEVGVETVRVGVPVGAAAKVEEEEREEGWMEGEGLAEFDCSMLIFSNSCDAFWLNSDDSKQPMKDKQV